MSTKPEDAARAKGKPEEPGARAAWALVILLSITGVGWLDASVDPDVGFSLFYLLPVAAGQLGQRLISRIKTLDRECPGCGAVKTARTDGCGWLTGLEELKCKQQTKRCSFPTAAI